MDHTRSTLAIDTNNNNKAIRKSFIGKKAHIDITNDNLSYCRDHGRWTTSSGTQILHGGRIWAEDGATSYFTLYIFGVNDNKKCTPVNNDV